jgi:hypothetical protein
VVGSFPPVTGPAASASIAAVRRAWAAGDEVVTASLRPGAADTVARVSGPAAGFRLERARVSAGGPRRLVLVLENAQLTGGHAEKGTSWVHRSTAGLRVAASIAGLVRTLDHFDDVTVVLSSALDVPKLVLAVLWRHVDSVFVSPGTERFAQRSRVPAGLVSITESYPLLDATPGVTTLGPPEILPELWLRESSVRLVVIVLRRLLGRHYVPIRLRAGDAARLLRRISQGLPGTLRR